MFRSPRRGEGKPSRGPRPKRHMLAPEAVGRERESEAVAPTTRTNRRGPRRVYGSQNQQMHASPVFEQVTPSSLFIPTYLLK